MSELKIDIDNHVMPRTVANRIRELAPGRGNTRASKLTPSLARIAAVGRLYDEPRTRNDNHRGPGSRSCSNCHHVCRRAASRGRCHQSDVPSSCSFWRRAEQGVFYAPAEAHFKCPVGAMVMGFELPQPVVDELGQLVNNMCDCGYMASDEAAHIPTVPFRPKGTVYGPLAAFPLHADAVVCWLSPVQAMIWNEACGEGRWDRDVSAAVTGRPACAALPAGINENRPVLSFGCMGMRTFTEVADDRMLATIPGAVLAEFASKLQAMRSTNDAMQSFYKGRLSSP